MKYKVVDFFARIKFWLETARYYSLPQTIVPYIFAAALASKDYEVDLLLSVLGLAGVVMAHLSVNLLDDYFDWKKGAVSERKALPDGGLRARTNKCNYLEQNLTTPDMVLKVALGLGAVAFLLGCFIAYEVSFGLLLIAAITGFLGFFYAAPPIRLSYHGLGEIAVGIIFGPLLMIGAYLTAGGMVDEQIFYSSVMVGIFVLNILHTHCIMDFEPDKKVGRVSLAVLLGSSKNAYIFQIIMVVFVYLLLGYAIIVGVFPPLSLLTFLTLPKAVAFLKLMNTDTREKKLWMGPMEYWETMKSQGMDWFMLRWYLSRNILTDFMIILGVTYLIG